jgi:hypothetical protein
VAGDAQVGGSEHVLAPLELAVNLHAKIDLQVGDRVRCRPVVLAVGVVLVEVPEVDERLVELLDVAAFDP